MRLLKRAISPQGFNLGTNLGRCAGAGVPGHVHQHIVPRWNGDTNFMSVVGDIRVVPQAMTQLYDELIRQWVIWTADCILREMDQTLRSQLKPGAQVKVTQQIAARDYAWSSDVRGTVVEFEQKPTGSWFAHSKDDELWLDRLVLRKEDGEITTLNLDEFSHVEVESQATTEAPAASES